MTPQLPGGGGPAPAPKNRKPLYITAAATVAVLTVIGLVMAFLLGSGGEEDVTPNNEATEVAKTYLEALARGDAEKALSLSATEPATKELLTNDVLKQQQEKLPISDIEVLGEAREPDDDKKTTTVKVAAKFGGQRTEGKLNMVVADGQWKLGAAFVNVTPNLPGGLNGALAGINKESVAESLKLFGKPMPESGHAYVFPGWLEMTASTPYVDVNESPPTTLDDVDALSEVLLEPKFTMNDKGRKAAEAAVRAWYEKCLSPTPKEGDCSKVGSGWGPEYDLATTRLRGPIDLNQLQFEMANEGTVVRVTGTVKDIPFTVEKDGAVAEVTADISAPWINLGQDPPAVIIPAI